MGDARIIPDEEPASFHHGGKLKQREFIGQNGCGRAHVPGLLFERLQDLLSLSRADDDEDPRPEMSLKIPRQLENRSRGQTFFLLPLPGCRTMTFALSLGATPFCFQNRSPHARSDSSRWSLGMQSEPVSPYRENSLRR